MVVITSSNISNFLNGSLDVKAIQTLLNNNVSVRNYQNLHAKIYLFDREKVLITSANLTHNGLYKNYEYGVLCDESNFVDEVYNDYVKMITDEDCGEFKIDTLKRVEEIRKTLGKNIVIYIDSDNDHIILENLNNLTKKLNTWQKAVFDLIETNFSSVFDTNSIYALESELKKSFPNNHHIKDKIRQILQQLRELGYIKFISRGVYKKLWIKK